MALVSQLNPKSSELPPELEAGFHSIFEAGGSKRFHDAYREGNLQQRCKQSHRVTKHPGSR